MNILRAVREKLTKKQERDELKKTFEEASKQLDSIIKELERERT